MSLFYIGDPSLNNVNAMVTDNTKLYMSTSTKGKGIISLSISSPTTSSIIPLSYYEGNIINIAYYNNHIYFSTLTEIKRYSITNNSYPSTKVFIPPIGFNCLCINSKNGNVYYDQIFRTFSETIKPTPRLFIYNHTLGSQLTNSDSELDNTNDCEYIFALKPNDQTVYFPLSNSQILSMTTDNTNVYLLVMLKITVGNSGLSNVSTVANTILVVFSNVETNYWKQGVFYILSEDSRLYRNMLYNNGNLYFTQNTSYQYSSNYVVKTDLTGSLVNPVSYLGGTSSSGGGMTFDSNGSFYVTYDFIPSTPNNTSILATLVPPCFKSGTLILTNKGYFPVESLQSGDLIQTYKHGFVPIYKIGKKEIYHPAENSRIKSQLYRCSQNKYPELFEDLIITGCHSLLVDSFESEEQKRKTIEVNKDAYVTDGKLRLPACVDDKTEVYENEGTYTIYHFALENDNYYANYGIYANGLLVETCSKRYITELANMEIV